MPKSVNIYGLYEDGLKYFMYGYNEISVSPIADRLIVAMCTNFLDKNWVARRIYEARKSINFN